MTSRRAYLAEEQAHRENELRASELETVAKVSAATEVTSAATTAALRLAGAGHRDKRRSREQ